MTFRVLFKSSKVEAFTMTKGFKVEKTWGPYRGEGTFAMANPNEC